MDPHPFPDAPPGGEDETWTIVCSSEAETFCENLEVPTRIEAPGTTFDRLSSADPSELATTLWIVAEPWPQLLDLARQEAGLPADRSVAAIGLRAGRPRRTDAGHGGARKRLRIGHIVGVPRLPARGGWTSIGVPETSWTAGVLSVVALANGILGSGSYARNEMGDPQLTTALEQIKAADGNQSPNPDPFQVMVTRPGSYELALGIGLGRRREEPRGRLVVSHDDAGRRRDRPIGDRPSPPSLDAPGAAEALGSERTSTGGWMRQDGIRMRPRRATPSPDRGSSPHSSRNGTPCSENGPEHENDPPVGDRDPEALSAVAASGCSGDDSSPASTPWVIPATASWSTCRCRRRRST